MFMHVVMWKLKEVALGADKAENARKMKVMLEGLKNEIPQIKDVAVGIDVSATDSSFDVVLYSVFESRADCDIYMKHPAHLKAAEFIGEVRAERILVDYEN